MLLVISIKERLYIQNENTVANIIWCISCDTYCSINKLTLLDKGERYCMATADEDGFTTGCYEYMTGQKVKNQ